MGNVTICGGFCLCHAVFMLRLNPRDPGEMMHAHTGHNAEAAPARAISYNAEDNIRLSITDRDSIILIIPVNIIDCFL